MNGACDAGAPPAICFALKAVILRGFSPEASRTQPRDYHPACSSPLRSTAAAESAMGN
jgi:hypothetical protein